jgi:hypothetical protein
MPDPDDQRLRIQLFFVEVFQTCFEFKELGKVTPAPTLGGRLLELGSSVPRPILAYHSATNTTPDRGPAPHDAPDFLLELDMKTEELGKTLALYASIGTKEVLLIERDPWKFERYDIKRGRLRMTGVAYPGHTYALGSEVLPLTFALLRGRPRPKIRVTNVETGQQWVF